jgi:hypothetical protein
VWEQVGEACGEEAGGACGKEVRTKGRRCVLRVARKQEVDGEEVCVWRGKEVRVARRLEKHAARIKGRLAQVARRFASAEETEGVRGEPLEEGAARR